MAKKKTKKPAAQALSLTAEAGPKNPDAAPRPKDEEERELEKLVFGDLSGFQEGLREAYADEDQGYPSADESDAGLRAAGPLKANEDLNALHDDELFFLDTGPTPVEGLLRDADGDVDIAGTASKEPTGPQPAWEDSDDERVVISLMSQNRLKKYRETFTDDVVTGVDYIRRLRQQYERVYPVPAWALPQSEQQEHKRRRRKSVFGDGGSASDTESSSSDIEGEDEDSLTAAPLSTLLQSDSGYIRPAASTTKLRPEKIDIARLRDANHLSPQQSSVGSLSFHPTHPLLMSAGFDHTMRLYHIDGKVNPPVTSLYFKSTPLVTASFHPDGKRVFAAGRRSCFYIWDLESGGVGKVTRVYGRKKEQRSMEYFKLSPDGKYMGLVGSKGMVNILSADTGQWVATAQVEGVVADIAWYSPSSMSPHPGLTIANKHGELWEYDMDARKFSGRWLDEGGVATTKIALGGRGDRYVAVGSAQGIVNVYDRRPIAKGSVGLGDTLKPIKALGNLVTSISSLEFGVDGQVLCMASNAKKDALRLVHMPSCTVYQNWPTSATPLGKVDSVAFAPGVNMLAAGNEAGKVRLWEIRP
ncbi:WD40-repeat-containing domain protein [Kalaharituber pfeilii]|nr:WD40-repeat-containing domain protein [Kalaharituber pfeilii]